MSKAGKLGRLVMTRAISLLLLVGGVAYGRAARPYILDRSTTIDGGGGTSSVWTI